MGVEEQKGEAEQELAHFQDLDLSSSDSSSSSSDSSSESGSSSCSSTPDSSRAGSVREEGDQNWAEGDQGSGGEDSPGVGDEEMEMARSGDPGEASEGDRGRGGEEEQGNAPAGPAGVLVKVIPRLPPRFIPGWILRGRTRAGLRSSPGLKSIARREIRSYPIILARRKRP